MDALGTGITRIERFTPSTGLSTFPGEEAQPLPSERFIPGEDTLNLGIMPGGMSVFSPGKTGAAVPQPVETSPVPVPCELASTARQVQRNSAASMASSPALAPSLGSALNPPGEAASAAPGSSNGAGIILQIDNFGTRHGGIDHGEEVRGVIVDETGREDLVQVRDVSRAESCQPPRYSTFVSAEEWLESLTQDTVESQVEALEDVCGAMQEFLADPDSHCRVINLSLAQGTLYGLQPFYRQVLNPNLLPGQRQENLGKIRPILGLEPEASLDQVVMSLARTLKESESKDPRFVAARTGYDRLCEQALERDVVIVVAAGNSGEFARVLMSHGVTDPGFYHNVLSNPHTLVVGALEPSGRPADYATPQAGAQIGANGVSTRHKEPGSSFAAPRVAEAIALMTVGLPGLSAVAARDLLLEKAEPVLDPQRQVGGKKATLLPVNDVKPRPPSVLKRALGWRRALHRT